LKTLKSSKRYLAFALTFLMPIYTNFELLAEQNKEKIEVSENIKNKEEAKNEINKLIILTQEAEENNNLNKAIFYLEKIISLEKKFLGEKHPDVINTSDWIAYNKLFNNRYDEAEIIFKNNLRLRRKVLGEMHPDQYLGYIGLGKIYEYRGSYKKAEEYFLKALKLKQEEDVDPLAYTSLLELIGDLYLTLNEFEKAEEYLQSSLEIKKKKLKKNDPEILLLLNELGYLNQDRGLYKKAEDYFLESLEIAKENENEFDLQVSYFYLGSFYKKIGLLDKAEYYYLNALSIREKLYGKEDSSLATTLNQIGELYLTKGLYKKAKDYYLRSLSLREKELGANHPDVSFNHMWLGNLYQEIKDYRKAEDHYFQALSIRKNAFGNNHPEVADSLFWIGYLYKTKGEFNKSEDAFLRCLNIREIVFGEINADVAISLNWLGDLYQEQSKYKKAEKNYLRALKINKKLYGNNHTLVAGNLQFLGQLYQRQGLYEKAEEYYLDALEINENIFGKDSFELGNVLSWLGDLYKELDYLDKAEKIYKRSINIFKNSFGENHPSLARNYGWLGDVYQKQDLFENSEKFYKNALKIYKSNYGENNPENADIYNYLGTLYMRQSLFKEAEESHRKALEITKKYYGNNTKATSTSYFWLGDLFAYQKQYEKAKNSFLKALIIKEDLFGKSDYRNTYDLMWLQFVNKELGEIEESNVYMKRALEIFLSKMQREMPNLPLNERNKFAQKIDLRIPDVIFQNALETSNYSNRELALFLRLNRQGLLEDIEKTQGNLLNLKDDQKNIYFEIRNLTEQLANKNINTKEALDLNKKKALLEKKLFLSLPSTKPKLYSVKEIANNLPKDSKLIEFQKYMPFKKEKYSGIGITIGKENNDTFIEILSVFDKGPARKMGLRKGEFIIEIDDINTKDIDLNKARSLIRGKKDQKLKLLVQKNNKKEYVYLKRDTNIINNEFGPERYLALILSKNGEINVVDLGESKVIDNEIKNALFSSEESLYDSQIIWDSISNKLINPLLKNIKDSKRLIISPDSEINRVAFSALRSPKEKTKFLNEDFEINLITTGREITKIKSLSKASNTSLVVANPNFNADLNLNDFKKSGLNSFSHNRSNDCSNESWGKLPGTLKEGQIISEIIGANFVQGKLATSNAIKKIKSPKILHIATHSYYCEDNETKKSSENYLNSPKTNNFSESLILQEEIPLLKSGIVLAGANNFNKDKNDDGYLTALEVTKLNWEGTELVVISGCQSGLGTIQSGEGVYGLKRAISVAGANSSLLSLWKVNDAGTAAFMESFYLNLKNGDSKSKALAKTQKEFRNHSIPGYRHPHVWAAFQLSGDWRPIDF